MMYYLNIRNRKKKKRRRKIILINRQERNLKRREIVKGEYTDRGILYNSKISNIFIRMDKLEHSAQYN